MQVADPLAIHSSEVSNVIVWGNPTSTSALDVLHGTVRRGLRVVPVQNCVDDELVQIMSQAVRERTTAIVQVSIVPALLQIMSTNGSLSGLRLGGCCCGSCQIQSLASFCRLRQRPLFYLMRFWLNACGARLLPAQQCHRSGAGGDVGHPTLEQAMPSVQARNLTPALSVAGAICDHFHDWLLGTPEGTWVSMGVASDGSYGVPENLYFSFPVTCRNNQWHIVQVRHCLPDLLHLCFYSRTRAFTVTVLRVQGNDARCFD